MNNIWATDYSTIMISKKFLGIWWEFWSEPYHYYFDNQTEHFKYVRDKYIKKFKGKPFRMRLYYPDQIRNIN